MASSRIDPDAYAEGVAAFTEDGMVQLVTIIGYYGLVSLTLNAFEVQVTPDMSDPFPAYS